MTPNKLPPLPEPSDDDLPVPIAYGMRRKGEISVIGVVPNKVHVKPATSETYLREFEEVALFTAEQLHAAREQAFHDGQCEALRQSQSLPAGAVAGLVGKWRTESKRVWYSDHELGQNSALECCADELEQALQADAREKGEACAICDGTGLVPLGAVGGKGYCKACKPQEYTYGHCDEKKRAGGCRRHNLQCGYPDCDRRPIATQPAQASEKVSQWQPIATAPKDGTRILAFAGSRPFIAHHGRTIGWWDDNDLMRDPTHWQPMPDTNALATSSQETASE